MADFHIADALVREIEGGYVFDPSDRGGETYCGISRRFWPHELIWRSIDLEKQRADFPRNIDHKALDSLVEEFYCRNFWRPIKGDQIPNQLIANQLYDIAVNTGVKKAARYFQRALNLLNRNERDYDDVVEDGRIGRKTLMALDALLKRRVNGVYLIGFYLLVQIGGLWVRLASKDPTQEQFMNGWGKRGLTTAKHYAEHYFEENKHDTQNV